MRATLASLVEDWRRLDGETAVVHHRGNRAFRTSYGELAALAGRFSAELHRRNIGPGDRVLLWGENSPAWMAAFFGCMLRGALAVPLDATGAASFASRVAAEVQPMLVVGEQGLLQQLEFTADRLLLNDLQQVLPAQPDFALSPAVTGDTPFQIVFTSGTTSEPKGVVHTHRNVLASLRPIESEIEKYRRYERWVHPLRFLHTLPFSHVFGQFMGLWIPAVLGAQVHLPANVELAQVVATVRRERISVIVAVPRVLELLRDHLRRRFPHLQASLLNSPGSPAWKRWWRFRSVHHAFGFKFWAFICGGATLPLDLESFWTGLGFALVQGYGMTETAALVTLNHPFKVGKGTLGKALPGREVKLGADGEILVRGDMLAAGTWKNGSYQPRTEEWLATGDLATQDASGELRFSGRRGDVIVTSAGLNVYPADVEAALLKQPEVQACVVVGCESSNGLEPVAVAIFQGDGIQLRDVMQRANRELAPHQQLRRLLRWPEPQLPFTSTGKLLRRQVASWACARMNGGDRSSLANDDDALLRLMAQVTGEAPQQTSNESRLTEDLHLDSLGRVQLQSALEQQFGVELRDEQIGAIDTLGQLRALLPWSRGGAGLPAEGSDLHQVAEATAESKSAPDLRLPRWPWSRPVQWFRSVFLELVAMPLVRVLGRPRVVRDEAQLDAAPMLLIANHVNTFDLPLVLYALGGRRRRWVTTAMSAEVLADLRAGRNEGSWWRNLLARPAYWLLLALFNVFPLPRLSGFRKSFAHAGQALDRGYSVLVFPEGRRGWTGELQPFRPGIGLLVQTSQVPVLPIALQGMGASAREGARWPWSVPPAVHVGRVLRFAPESTPEEITRVLEARLRALKPS